MADERPDDRSPRRARLAPQAVLRGSFVFARKLFHVQTDDLGVDDGHIVTQVFTEGGRIVAVFRRSYRHVLELSWLGTYIAKVMALQHQQMKVAVRQGDFDDVIHGTAPARSQTWRTEMPPAR